MGTLLPRCVGMTRDGSQCGRRVPDGSNPPQCHLHRPNPNLSPIIPDPGESVDALKILRRLAKDKDARVRLRAVDLLLSLKDHENKAADACARCARMKDDNGFKIEALSVEERRRMIVLVAEIKRIKNAVRERITNGTAVYQSFGDEDE